MSDPTDTPQLAMPATDNRWTVLGYALLIGAVLALMLMLGLPQLNYDAQVKTEIVALLRDVAIAAAGHAFGRMGR